jgi:hypothetical protein
VTIYTAVFILLAFLCFGMLLGTAWTTQILQPKLRRQAEERRRLNAEWQAVRDAQRSIRLVRCPRCGCQLSEGAWYSYEEDEEENDEPDDDD